LRRWDGEQWVRVPITKRRLVDRVMEVKVRWMVGDSHDFAFSLVSDFSLVGNSSGVLSGRTPSSYLRLESTVYRR
jgi:hypothetical protein